jgi:O-antigen/teichoic acid export membrane protein
MSDATPLTANSMVVDTSAALPPRARQLIRYVFSALGPISMAGAHFIGALIFFRTLPRSDFGLLSFAMAIVPLFLSLTGAMFGASLVNSANGTSAMSEDELHAYMKGSLLFASASGAILFALMVAATATSAVATIVALYGAVMSLRWFARCHAFATHNMKRAIISDVVYSAMLLGNLLVFNFARQHSPVAASAILSASAFCALLAFGGDFMIAQRRAILHGSLRAFMPIWRDLSRWSVLGVVSTEITANAHVYLVTFIAGPKAFALLAVGSLFMRPVSLVVGALPDAERPTMARDIAQGKFAKAMRSVFQFRMASLAVLTGTLMLAAIILIWFPQLILKKGYDETSVIAVVAIWTLIMAVRAMRTPESILLQTLGEYRALAAASVSSSFASLAITLALLLCFGPVVSLVGILVGDIVMSWRILAMGRAWRKKVSV